VARKRLSRRPSELGGSLGCRRADYAADVVLAVAPVYAGPPRRCAPPWICLAAGSARPGLGGG
jgi:hypothetical protein